MPRSVPACLVRVPGLPGPGGGGAAAAKLEPVGNEIFKSKGPSTGSPGRGHCSSCRRNKSRLRPAPSEQPRSTSIRVACPGRQRIRRETRAPGCCRLGGGVLVNSSGVRTGIRRRAAGWAAAGGAAAAALVGCGRGCLTNQYSTHPPPQTPSPSGGHADCQAVTRHPLRLAAPSSAPCLPGTRESPSGAHTTRSAGAAAAAAAGGQARRPSSPSNAACTWRPSGPPADMSQPARKAAATAATRAGANQRRVPYSM